MDRIINTEMARWYDKLAAAITELLFLERIGVITSVKTGERVLVKFYIQTNFDTVVTYWGRS